VVTQDSPVLRAWGFRGDSYGFFSGYEMVWGLKDNTNSSTDKKLRMVLVEARFGTRLVLGIGLISIFFTLNSRSREDVGCRVLNGARLGVNTLYI